MAVSFADSLLGIGWDAPLPYAATGWLVEMMGWTGFFLLRALLALPGMLLLLLKVAPWGEAHRA